MTEWIQVTEKEFKIGENRISILDDSILFIEVIGEQTDDHARAIRQNFQHLFSLFPGKVKQLVDLNKSGKSSSAARELFKMLNDPKYTDKVAIMGMHPVARVLASFVIGTGKKKNVRIFSGREEALAWLKSETAE